MVGLAREKGGSQEAILKEHEFVNGLKVHGASNMFFGWMQWANSLVGMWGSIADQLEVTG